MPKKGQINGKCRQQLGKSNKLCGDGLIKSVKRFHYVHCPRNRIVFRLVRLVVAIKNHKVAVSMKPYLLLNYNWLFLIIILIHYFSVWFITVQ